MSPDIKFYKFSTILYTHLPFAHVRWAHACVLFRASKKFPGEFWQVEKERIWACKNSQGFGLKFLSGKG